MKDRTQVTRNVGDLCSDNPEAVYCIVGVHHDIFYYSLEYRANGQMELTNDREKMFSRAIDELLVRI